MITLFQQNYIIIITNSASKISYSIKCTKIQHDKRILKRGTKLALFFHVSSFISHFLLIPNVFLPKNVETLLFSDNQLRLKINMKISNQNRLTSCLNTKFKIITKTFEILNKTHKTINMILLVHLV